MCDLFTGTVYTSFLFTSFTESDQYNKHIQINGRCVHACACVCVCECGVCGNSLTDGGDVGGFEDGETGAVPPLSLEGSLTLLATHLLCNLQGHQQVPVLLTDIHSLVVRVKQLQAALCGEDCATAADATHSDHTPHQNNHRPRERSKQQRINGIASDIGSSIV